MSIAIGCALSVTERYRRVGAAVDAGGDDAELNATFSEPGVTDDVRMGSFTPAALARLLNL